MTPARPSPGPTLAVRLGGLLPYALLTVGAAVVLLQILLLNGGKLVYTLDDPYIHLAVAENIARGTYGVNLGESSAPSSSILYPFLFVPFVAFRVVEWMPLTINFLASLATVAAWDYVVASALEAPRGGRERLHAALLVALLIPATNLIGVMFTGMEHSLQLLASALLVAGLVAEREDGHAPWWLWAAIVLGPLIRYENLALSLPALGYLFARGQRRGSVGALALLGLLVGVFSAFLLASGHGPLPTSVMLKSGAAGSGGDPGTMVGTLVSNLFLRQGALLTLLGASFVGVAVAGHDRRDRALAAWGAAAVGLHLLVGAFGWFSRYELYVWSAALLTALVVFRGPLRRFAAATGPLTFLVAASGVALAIGFPYVYTTLKTPLGSNNIYEQHYQMHRFATEFYDGPVAVTDLGWVSFRNDRYVLDLWGLALAGAAEARRQGGVGYMGELARERDVKLAMLYGAWYPELPEGWTPVAEMGLGKRLLTPAAAVVTFYALDPAEAPRIRGLLRDFGPTLPPGVAFTILD